MEYRDTELQLSYLWQAASTAPDKMLFITSELASEIFIYMLYYFSGKTRLADNSHEMSSLIFSKK